jgi:hypothetical protein
MAWPTRSWRAVLVAFSAFAMHCSASAELALNKLNNCDGLRTVWTQLDGNATIEACRPPATAVEAAIAQRIYGACIVVGAPAPFLQDYSCVAFGGGDPPELRGFFCFRETSLDEVKAYRQQHDTTYSAQVNRYLIDAGSCDPDGGYVVRLNTTVAQPVMQHLALTEFGYMSLRVSGGDTFHSYGVLDPSLIGEGRAIETIEFQRVRPPLIHQPFYEKAGRWELATMRSFDLDESSNASYKSQGIQLREHRLALRIRSAENRSDTREQRWQELAAFQDILLQILEEKNFIFRNDEQLRLDTGTSYEAVYQHLLAPVPYAVRKRAYDETGGMRVFIRDDWVSCSQPDGRSIISMVSRLPGGAAGREFGGIDILITDLGSCAATEDLFDSKDALFAMQLEFRDFLESD